MPVTEHLTMVTSLASLLSRCTFFILSLFSVEWFIEYLTDIIKRSSRASLFHDFASLISRHWFVASLDVSFIWLLFALGRVIHVHLGCDCPVANGENGWSQLCSVQALARLGLLHIMKKNFLLAFGRVYVSSFFKSWRTSYSSPQGRFVLWE